MSDDPLDIKGLLAQTRDKMANIKIPPVKLPDKVFSGEFYQDATAQYTDALRTMLDNARKAPQLKDYTIPQAEDFVIYVSKGRAVAGENSFCGGGIVLANHRNGQPKHHIYLSEDFLRQPGTTSEMVLAALAHEASHVLSQQSYPFDPRNGANERITIRHSVALYPNPEAHIGHLGSHLCQ